MAVQLPTIWVYYELFNYSPINEHSVYFHFAPPCTILQCIYLFNEGLFLIICFYGADFHGNEIPKSMLYVCFNLIDAVSVTIYISISKV